MLDGYYWRLKRAVRPFALQSFITSSMFSKDIVFSQILETFEGVVGIPKGKD